MMTLWQVYTNTRWQHITACWDLMYQLVVVYFNRKKSSDFKYPDNFCTVRKLMSHNFDLINKPIYCEMDVLLAFETKLYVSNCNYQ